MKNVGIICGGFSSEFDISVKSATNIHENFPDGYRTFLILLKKEGWFVQMENSELIQVNAGDLSFNLAGDSVQIDVAIVFIHGDPGENGKVQAYLDMIDIPYVNSGPLASELSFDKWYCNQFLRGFDILVAESIYLTSSDDPIDEDSICNQLGLPLFVKPCDSGSSYGIARVNEKKELIPAILDAFNEGRTVIIESFLDGTEVTCGVYRNTNGLVALPLTEIVTENIFFDYEAKYEGLSDEITPARISDEMTTKVQSLSKKIYDLLQLGSISRIDYMLVDNEPYVIEVNTTPGFSDESIVPKMIEAASISMKDFWGEIMKAEFENQ
jgi:D-alanine-D-alanine ligase